MLHLITLPPSTLVVIAALAAYSTWPRGGARGLPGPTRTTSRPHESAPGVHTPPAPPEISRLTRPAVPDQRRALCADPTAPAAQGSVGVAP
jgi:hypothetical protein